MLKKKKLSSLIGFDSGVTSEKIGHFKFDRFDGKEPHEISARIPIFKIAIFVILFLFLARLFILTVVFGEKNRTLAEGNRIRLINIEALRGKILASNGQILAQSQRVYILKKGEDEKEISENVAKELENKNLAGENFEGELGQIFVRLKRDYPLGEAASHILGYVSAVGPDDLGQNSKLIASDSVGRLGVEETYENFLAGTNGKKLTEVDADGKKISVLGNILPVGGQDIYLAVDPGLQKVAYDSLRKQAEKAGSKKGAAIVSNPYSGEVMALVSLPGFDPNNVGAAIVSPDKPLFNRATSGTYPPGSVFKIISALAGLESGKITKDTEIEDVGEFELGGAKFSNWFYNQYGGKDGVIKIDRAIARSNDIFFYRLAERTGLESLRKMAIKFGLGQKTGIDLVEESFGLVPDEVWKKAALNDSWYTGDTMHLGIGQGFISTTPMQINVLTSYMASGKIYKPHIVSKIKTSSGETKIENKLLAENLVSQTNFDLVRDGMKQACEKSGTAYPFFEAPYRVGCKTGTAEKFEGNPHAWFTAFAPFDVPKLAVTVIIEDGGEGSSVAAPVAREILDWYYSVHRSDFDK